jgi:phospholipid-transporting ATPase
MYALVVYTGKDSKIILNQGSYKYKYSSIEKGMNIIFGFQIFQVFLLCFIFTMCNWGFVKENEDSPQYDITPDTASGVVGFSFLSFFLMLMRLVPLDLIINTEVGKIVVSKFIESDFDMVKLDDNGDMICCRVQSMQLPEELGCVHHIFCDKTGTLTKNELEFRGISFKGHLSQGMETAKILQGVYQHNSPTAELLFKCFVICHDVVPMQVKGETVMSGTSQDELIVIDVARQSLYFTLIKRDSDFMVLKDNQSNQEISIEILKTFEFSSDRKMMTVVCKMNGKTYAFIKGADTSMEPRLINLDEDDKLTLDDLDDFAEQGLRTLVYGYKEMADMSAEQIDELECTDVECDLTMLGITGVEDLLQDDVAQCIVDFKEGGCKVWILTGDKGATANQIGISCGVLSPKREIVQIDELNDKTDPKAWKGKDVLIGGQVITELLEAKASGENNMIDYLMDSEGLVVYRSSPQQKADIVRTVKKARKNAITLAIGDGANDVNMIDSAHVGVGIMGKEGNQAASFADFAINQYSDLRRLLFWHGSNWAAKITMFTLMIITKTSVFGLSNVLFNTTAAFSSTNIITDAFFAVYSINVTWYGFYLYFDQYVSFSRYRKNEGKLPFKMAHHYQWIRDFQVGKWIRNFMLWVVLYYYAAAVCFMVPFYAYGAGVNEEGKTVGLWTCGMMIYILCVWFTHLLFFTYFRELNLTVIIIGLIVWVQWIIVAAIINAAVKSDPMYKAVWENLFSDKFVLVFFITLALMILPTYIYKQVEALIVFPQFTFS